MINLLFLVLVLTYQRDFYKSKSDPDTVNWTQDQLIYSQSLYQLSYIRLLQITFYGALPLSYGRSNNVKYDQMVSIHRPPAYDAK